jgi:hypothetical protein
MCASCSATPWVASSSSSTHVGVGDRLQGLDHRELLDGLEDLALATQARGVDQLEALAVSLERHVDRVARGAGQVEGDRAAPRPARR